MEKHAVIVFKLLNHEITTKKIETILFRKEILKKQIQLNNLEKNHYLVGKLRRETFSLFFSLILSLKIQLLTVNNSNHIVP